MAQELDQGKIVGAIREATDEVFSTMLGLEITAGEPYRQSSKPEPVSGVVALIGLTGQWVGTGSIACSAEFACKISGHLLMTEYKSVDQEVLDAVGEVTNMIIGNVKNALEDEAGPMGMSIPVVVFGDHFIASNTNTVDWVVVPFTSNGGRMEVKACLSPQAEPQYRRRTADNL
jgi:chemotaxis protein CheX